MPKPSFQSYRDLVVWQAAMALAEDCYRMTSGFPRTEMFGLTSQIRRAAASIPANIAEGHGRESTGSLAERVGLLRPEPLEEAMARCNDVGKMLRSLIRSLQNKGSPS